MDRVVITQRFAGFAHMQVCAAPDVTDAEILAVCNAENPSGTRGGWSAVCRTGDTDWGAPGAIPCDDDPTRVHILVAC